MASTVSRNLVEILIQAQDQASSVFKKAGGNVTTFEKQVTVAAAAMAAAGASFLASVSAAAVAGGRYADALQDLSDRTLVSRDTLAALGVQLVRGGGQFEDAEVAVRTFDRAVIDAVGGQKEAIAQFERLGISVDDLVGPGGKIRGFEELLPRVAGGFVTLRDEATRVDSAVALFGRSATSLVPILSRGEDGLAQMRKESRDLNAVLGGPLQDNAARFGDRLDTLKLAATGLNNSLAGALDPTLGRTISALADAAKAAAQFAQENPRLLNTIVETVAVLAGSAGLIAALTVGRARLLQWLSVTLTTSGALKGLGGAFTDVGGRVRTAGGQFTTARGAALANALALVRVGVAATGAAVAIGLLVDENQKMLASQDAQAAASKRAEETLRSETATIQEQIAALDTLREAKGRAAEKEPAAAPPVVLRGEARFAFDRVARERAREEAIKEFDRENAKLRQSLIDRAEAERLTKPITVGGLIIKPSPPKIEPVPPVTIPPPKVAVEGVSVPGPKVTVGEPQLIVEPLDPVSFEEARARALAGVKPGSITLPGPRIEFERADPDAIQRAYEAALGGLDTTPTAPIINVPAPKIVVAPIDDRDFVSQIKRQNELLAKAQEEVLAADVAVARVQNIADPGLKTNALAAQEQALGKVATAEQRLSELQRQAAESTRQTTRAAQEARGAFTELDAAARRISIEDAFTKNLAALETANVELDKARASFEAAIPGTAAYAKAVDQVSDAIQRQEQAQGRLDATSGEIESRRQTEVAGAAAMETALRDLARAEEDLQTVRSKGATAGVQAQLDARNLARLEEERNRTRGLADVTAGPVPPERFQAAAEATRVYTDALLQAHAAQEKLSLSATLADSAIDSAGNTLISVLGSIGGATLDVAELFKRMALSIISDLLRIIITAKLAKIATTSVGTVGFPVLGPFGAIFELQSGGEVIRGIRGTDNIGVRVGRGEGVFDHRLMDDMRAFLAENKRTGGQPRRALDQPPIEFHQHTTINSGVTLGTEIETHRFGREINRQGADFARDSLASPGFAR